MGATHTDHVQLGSRIDQGAAGSGKHCPRSLHGKLAASAQRSLLASLDLWEPTLVPHGSGQRPHQHGPMGPE
jgi:hypothetical protein